MYPITASIANQRATITSWIPRLIILGAIFLGTIHTWAAITSYSMNEDGINYLDIGDAYWRGDWKAAINPVWSPLYSWILGGVIRLFQPGMRWEFPLVQIVNFVIYLLALASFAFFWKQVGEFRHARLAGEPVGVEIIIPEWAFNALGFLLFTWSSLTLIEIWSVTPDMLMSAIVYLIGGVFLRMLIHTQHYPIFVLFGVLLGISYLAKAIMLPVSFLFLGASLLAAGGLRHVFPRVLVALTVFLLIVGPYITLISLAKGHFTYGESGSITFLRHVNHIPFPHWQGGEDSTTTPMHPSRLILAAPPIYEFGTPIGGTYPISYDPSYWYEGVQPDYSLNEILPSFLSNVLVYFDIFFYKLGPVMAAIVILYLLANMKYKAFSQIIRNWSLAIISLLTLMIYSLVYVEGRYIAVFIVFLIAALLSNLSLQEHKGISKLITVATLVMIVTLLANLVASNLDGFIQLSSRGEEQPTGQVSSTPAWPGEVAEELQRLGIQAGDHVAVIGYAYDSFWARLARVKIVAEMLDVDANPFWYGNAELQAKVIKAFQSTSAKAIVAEEVPNQASLSAWHQVGNTNVYIYLFDE